MEILVNEEPLDFTLERESSLGEIVDGLTDWLGTSQFAITGIDVDATPVRIDDRSSWEHISIDGVEQVRVEALPLSRIEHTSLAAIDEYFSILDTCISTSNSDALADALQELPAVRERMQQLFPHLVGSDGAIEILVGLTPDNAASQIESQAAALRREIATLRTILHARMREFESPGAELAGTLRALEASLPGLEEIPVWLQTNRQKDAMNAVVALTELLGKAVRLTPLVEDEDERSARAAAVRQTAVELGPFLRELSEALEGGDTVLVGDLLEYEIAPIVKRLVEHT